MRLPITPQISTKDGTSNKNARLTNMLKVAGPKDIAEIRPGLVSSSTYAGLGSGLIEFDGRLLAIYDDTVFVDDGGLSEEWPLDSDPWASGTTYGYGDSVWYLGTLWFSTASGNTNNTPSATSAYWETSWEPDEWDSSATYTVGQLVSYGGSTYYLWASSSTNQNPASNPTLWKATAPNTALTIGTVTYSAPIVALNGTQTASWTVYNGATPVGSGSGTLTASLSGSITTMSASNWPRESTSPIGTIALYLPMPAGPPVYTFSGSTQWSGLPGWDNFAWSPTQSGGSWIAIGI